MAHKALKVYKELKEHRESQVLKEPTEHKE
jgi:hypothetical protein